MSSKSLKRYKIELTSNLNSPAAKVKRALNLVNLIGKWSMADVFAVAILIVYFTFSKGESQEAEIQVGFYFFVFYAILSNIATNLLLKAKKEVALAAKEEQIEPVGVTQ